MNYTLERMAGHLVLVAQGHGKDMFDQEAFEKEYRFKKDYHLGHLWGLGKTALKEGYFKFELERDYVESHLPILIEPKSFWKRNFSDWK